MAIVKRLEVILDSQEIKSLWGPIKNAYLKAKEDILRIIEGIDVSKLEDLWKKDVIERCKESLSGYFFSAEDFSQKEMSFFIFDRDKKLNESYRSSSFLLNLANDCRDNKVKLDRESLVRSKLVISDFWVIMEKIGQIIFDDYHFPDDSQKQEKIIAILKEASSR